MLRSPPPPEPYLSAPIVKALICPQHSNHVCLSTLSRSRNVALDVAPRCSQYSGAPLPSTTRCHPASTPVSRLEHVADRCSVTLALGSFSLQAWQVPVDLLVGIFPSLHFYPNGILPSTWSGFKAMSKVERVES